MYRYMSVHSYMLLCMRISISGSQVTQKRFTNNNISQILTQTFSIEYEYKLLTVGSLPNGVCNLSNFQYT